MNSELPPISEKKKKKKRVFFFQLQTLIILQHRNHLILYNFGGSEAPASVPSLSPLVFSLGPGAVRQQSIYKLASLEPMTLC